jgi:antitoxin component YwqK of YwqJK toxin-antitoxin module
MKNIIVKSVNHYREGVLHGYSIAYHRDGTLRSRFHYDQGYEHGECTLWDESGELKYSGAYYRGFRDGGWKIKQKDGSFENVSYDGIASFKRLIELADISEEEYFRAKLLEAKYEMHIDKIPSELRDEVLLLWKSISDARYEILESQQAVAINSEAAASPR